MIGIDQLWPKFLKYQDFGQLKNNDFDFFWKREVKNSNLSFFVSWGDPSGHSSECLIETGFFRNSFHIDKYGLYQNSSLGRLMNERCVSYEAPKSWKKLNLCPKFGQPKDENKWDGVVLIGQYPNDRSVKIAGGSKKYYEFVENACKFYGKNLLIKNHPVMIKDQEHNDIVSGLCSRYGCEFGHFGHSIIQDCEFVLLFNSTFVVDAMMNYKPIVQYAPGYFYQSNAVFFSDGCLPTKIKSADTFFFDKALDFLAWKYCIHYGQSIENIRKIILSFKDGSDTFPLNEELSYARSMEKA